MRSKGGALQSSLDGLRGSEVALSGAAFEAAANSQLLLVGPQLNAVHIEYISADGMLRYSSNNSAHVGLFVGNRLFAKTRVMALLKARLSWEAEVRLGCRY